MPSSPPLPRRIDHFVILKDGYATRLNPPLQHWHYSTLGEVAMPCAPGQPPARIEIAASTACRSSDVRSAHRRAHRIVNATARTIEALADSIAYDSAFTQQLGPAGKFEIVPVYATRTCRECKCSSDRRTAKRGRQGQAPAHWVHEDLCSYCAANPLTE